MGWSRRWLKRLFSKAWRGCKEHARCCWQFRLPVEQIGLLVLLYKGVSRLFFTNILYSFNIHIVNFYFIILHSWIEQQLFNMFNICSIYFYTFDSLLLQIKELYRFSHFAQITKNISFSLSLVQFKILKTNTWAIY